MENNKNQFPSEVVTLPSKGLLYPEDSPLRNGTIEMKYMTAKEEDILTNQNLIENGTVIDKLLQSLIVTPIDYKSLLTGDKNAILVAARVLGYGKDYTFEYNGEEITVDLTSVEDKVIDETAISNGENKFDYTLPASEIPVTFRFLTHEDEQKIQAEITGLKKLNKNAGREITTRMKHVITSINGDSSSKTIRDFVDTKLLARDARELRNYIKTIQPDVDLTFDHEDRRGKFTKVTIPIGLRFFWPDVEL